MFVVELSIEFLSVFQKEDKYYQKRSKVASKTVLSGWIFLGHSVFFSTADGGGSPPLSHSQTPPSTAMGQKDEGQKCGNERCKELQKCEEKIEGGGA